jgi:hypothetical protein
VASRVSDRKTEGRDAVRVVGRSALATPGWRIVRSAEAEWRPDDLGWGPAYEPHRHPDGALLGGRLALPAGRYRLDLVGQDLDPQGPGPDLVVHAEPNGLPRATPLEPAPGRRAGTFDVGPGERAVTLSLRGGGPFVLEALRLLPSTISGDSGLSDRREGPR